MANKEQIAILKQGVEAWNRWRRRRRDKARPQLLEAVFKGMDLSGANLSHAELSGADFENATLSRANLSSALLYDADFRFANLTGANLSSAYLYRANLVETRLHDAKLTSANFAYADLTAADLTDTDLRGAILADANLSETDFSRANLKSASLRAAIVNRTGLKGANLQSALVAYTKFTDCDLSEVKGLDSIRHHGPSSIGIDTIYRSNGQVPESFLRECGVPEGFITEMHSLVGAADGIQFYSCFISYSSRDNEFAQRLHGRMRDAHLRVWFAPEDIQGGKKLHEQIDTAIRLYDKLLIVLSDASLQSEWVMTELRKAFKAQRQTEKRKLFPVRLVDFETLRDWECFDADSGKDLAVELREYFIPDFSNWKDHDQFEAAFDRLLNDFRAEERTANRQESNNGE